MRKLSFFLTLLGVVALTTGGRSQGYACEIKEIFSPGTTFVYQVENSGENYLFIARLISLENDEIRFKWMISNSMAQGEVLMTADALKNATKLMNYYQEGDYNLTDQTTGWLSSRVVENLKTGNAVELDVGEENTMKFFINFKNASKNYLDGIKNYPVLMDQKFGNEMLKYYPVINVSKFYEIRVLDHAKYNLILYMNLGWTIKLVAIL